ncbi:MAG: hypothetical protein JSU94_15935 [Phycisphaerales bacterium]|nr:MAG: hypothetical protein JSU94_15935 [Phycisphaerales bacterium]
MKAPSKRVLRFLPLLLLIPVLLIGWQLLTKPGAESDTSQVGPAGAKTGNTNQDDPSSHAPNPTTSDIKTASSSEPVRNVSPTLGLAELTKLFEQDVIEDARRQANIAAKRLRWLDMKKAGTTKWGSDKWMKEPDYYKQLQTPQLAQECFSRAIFGFAMTVYDDPMLGYSSLEIFHNGFAELFKREDMWKGILHVYDYLSLKLNPNSDLRTIVTVSNHFDAFARMYRIPAFKEQVKGRELIFLAANLQVLKRYRQYLEDYDPVALGTKGSPGFFGEPCSVARVALMLAKQVAPQKYAAIEPELKSVRWTKEQKVEDLKSFINLVIEGLDGIVSNQSERLE